MRTTNFLTVGLLFAICGIVVLPARAFTTLDVPVPGTFQTLAYDIDGDVIVGSYRAPRPNTNDIEDRPYFYDGTSYTTFDVPGASPSWPSEATGVDGQNIVGYYNDGSDYYGFLFDGTNYTTLDVPGGGSTQAWGIDGGNIVGQYVTGMSPGVITQHGFVFDGTSYTTLDVPGAIITYAYGIDGPNIVGTYFDAANSVHGFLFNGTSYTTLDVPGAEETWALGIDGDRIVGFSHTGLHDHGFVYDGTSFATLDLPGARDTLPLGIDGRRIAGAFVDSDQMWHGFVVPEPSSSALGFAGVMSLFVLRGRRRGRALVRANGCLLSAHAVGRSAAIALAALLAIAGPAPAWEVTMTGSIGAGSLNGSSIDGSDFVVRATIESDVDLSPLTDDGIFALSQAVMEIESTGDFVFDPASLYFGYLYEAPPMTSYGRAVVAFVDDPVNFYSQFGFEEFIPSSLPLQTPPFDSNVVQSLSIDTFNGSFAYGLPATEPAVFTNGSNRLTLAKLALPGSLTIVPEPSTIALALIGLFAVGGARHRLKFAGPDSSHRR